MNYDDHNTFNDFIDTIATIIKDSHKTRNFKITNNEDSNMDKTVSDIQKEYVKVCITGCLDQIKRFDEEYKHALVYDWMDYQAFKICIGKNDESITKYMVENHGKVFMKVLAKDIVMAINCDKMKSVYANIRFIKDERFISKIFKTACKRNVLQLVNYLGQKITEKTMAICIDRAIRIKNQELFESLIEIKCDNDTDIISKNGTYTNRVYNLSIAISAVGARNYKAFKTILMKLVISDNNGVDTHYDFINDRFEESGMLLLLEMCCNNPDGRYVSILWDFYKNGYQKISEYQSILEAACKNNHVRIVKTLVKNNNLTDIDKYLDIAIEKESYEVIDAFVNKLGIEIPTNKIQQVKDCMKKYYSILASNMD